MIIKYKETTKISFFDQSCPFAVMDSLLAVAAVNSKPSLASSCQ